MITPLEFEIEKEIEDSFLTLENSLQSCRETLI